MEILVLNKKETAKALGISEGSVDKLEKDCIIRRIKNLPGIRFSKKDIYALAKMDQTPMSPFERRRLEQERNKLQNEVDRLRAAIGRITAAVGEVMFEGR